MVSIFSDEALVTNYKNGINTEECLKEIIRRHSPLCVNMVDRFKNRLDASGAYSSDVISDTYSLIYKAMNEYDPTRNMKLSTYIGQTVRFHCLHLINRKSHYEISDPELLNGLIESKEFLNHQHDEPPRKDLTLDYVLDILKKLGDERILTIYKMRYSTNEKGKRHSLKVIGKKLNLTGELVRVLHNKALKFIRKQLKETDIYN